MTRPASFPGWSLESCGDAGPRGMAAHDRTRLIGRLPPHFPARSIGPPGAASTLLLPLAGEGEAAAARHLPLFLLPLAGEGAPQGRMRAALDLRACSQDQDQERPPSAASRHLPPQAGEAEAAAARHLRLLLLPLAGEGAPQGRMRAALDLRRGLLLAQRIPDTALRAATLREMLQSFQHLAARS